MNTAELSSVCKAVRRDIINMTANAGSGHPGGSLSAVELMVSVFFNHMRIDPQNPKMPERDRFVLSKGHAAPCYYAVLAERGFISRGEFQNFRQLHSILQGHPDCKKVPGVDASTGSLGQGMSEAIGAALGSRVQNRPSRVYVAVGDGECDEGQIWEGAQFAAQYKLDNLVCLVGNNGRQLDGAVADVMSHGKGIGAKFDAFGWNVIDVADGNDVEQIWGALEQAEACKGKPTCLILNTVKGKGATFAEPSGAHSSQPTKEQWDEAIAASEAALAAVKNEK